MTSSTSPSSMPRSTVRYAMARMRLLTQQPQQGAQADEAFVVKYARTTMPRADIDNGRLICRIGIALAKPGEFVNLCIQQMPHTSKPADPPATRGND
jgi:phage tail sheath protein FI